jgi:hypothetical protein
LRAHHYIHNRSPKVISRGVAALTSGLCAECGAVHADEQIHVDDTIALFKTATRWRLAEEQLAEIAALIRVANTQVLAELEKPR